MAKLSYYTEEGLQKLKEEFHQLVTVERPSISSQIADARDKGDLSENAEYDEAKNAQALLELRISKLQEVLNNARIVDKSKIDTSKVSLLSKVRLKNINTNTEMLYTIVSENEADLKEGKISINTPIVKSIIGKKVNDIVEVTVPAGIIKLKILEISK
ncbi:MAG: transcription elongation factor GreA [Bacteroidetes bacterium GWE2_29_8]|nr:MAG: transcription elongation factor GreA [Bacteroidetes bacterium GWE2_29_8]